MPCSLGVADTQFALQGVIAFWTDECWCLSGVGCLPRLVLLRPCASCATQRSAERNVESGCVGVVEAASCASKVLLEQGVLLHPSVLTACT